MTKLTIKKIHYFSFAKVLTIYSFIIALILSIVDLIVKLATGVSSFVGTNTWGSWLLYVVILLILTPIITFIASLITAWFLNLALKYGKGLELEVE